MDRRLERAAQAGRDRAQKNGADVVRLAAVLQAGFAEEIKEIGAALAVAALDDPPDRGDGSHPVILVQDLPLGAPGHREMAWARVRHGFII